MQLINKDKIQESVLNESIDYEFLFDYLVKNTFSEIAQINMKNFSINGCCNDLKKVQYEGEEYLSTGNTNVIFNSKSYSMSSITILLSSIIEFKVKDKNLFLKDRFGYITIINK